MNLIVKYVRPFLKAHLAGLGAAGTLLISDVNGNLNALNAVTGAQWVAAVCAAFGVGGVVAVAKNTPAPVVAPAPVAAAPVVVSQDTEAAPAA